MLELDEPLAVLFVRLNELALVVTLLIVTLRVLLVVVLVLLAVLLVVLLVLAVMLVLAVVLVLLAVLLPGKGSKTYVCSGIYNTLLDTLKAAA